MQLFPQTSRMTYVIPQRQRVTNDSPIASYLRQFTL